MAQWHEQSRIRGSLSRYSANWQAKLVVRMQEQPPGIFEVHFERKEVIGRTVYPEGWVQLWPLEPITGSTAPEAMAKALPLLEVVAGQSEDERFERRACPMPIRFKKVKEVVSPTHLALAGIYRHTESRYEVRYFGDVVGSQEYGWRLSVPPIEQMPLAKGFKIITLADTLESAEQIAVAELERIVADGEVKER